MKTLKLRLLAAPTLAALLAACGGGGGNAGGPPPVVTLSSASAAMYSQSLLVTLNGSNLDQGLSVASTGCRDIARSSAAPYVSSASVAYYQCTVSAVGTQQVNVARAGDGVALATVPFSVAVPQVTVSVSNGAAVNGNFVITLSPQQAPLTVDNFLAYVKSGFYVGTVFHRHVPGFVLQDGGYAAPIAAGPLPLHKPTSLPITLEDNAGLSNLRFTVAMARTNELDSATSEFFINLVDNVGLDRQGLRRGYAVFGSISTGTDYVVSMQGAPCSFFGSDTTTCIPVPNLGIASAVQTR